MLRETPLTKEALLDTYDGRTLAHRLATHESGCVITTSSSMRRILAILGSAIFLGIAPGIVAGYVPWGLADGMLEHRCSEYPPFGSWECCRLQQVFQCFWTSSPVSLQGLGTPAPIFPTRHLVVSGLFRYVRNPMYVAVVMLILGQGLLFSSVQVLEYGIAVWLGFLLFVVIYEEPYIAEELWA